MSQKIYALIVTFKPDVNVLDLTISKLVERGIQKVIIVDNNSNNFESIKELESRYPLTILKMDKNYGIGKAYNVAIDFVREKECSNSNNCSNVWILILDQDAKPLDNFNPLTVLEKLSKERKIGGVTINVKNSKILRRYSEDFYVVTYFSNAGCLFPLSTLSRLRFNEDLFLDRVDFDFYLKMKKKGLLMLGYKEQMLDHKLGSKVRYYRKRTIRMIVNLLVSLSPTLRRVTTEGKMGEVIISHEPFRNYLIIRNDSYLVTRIFFNIDRTLIKNNRVIYYKFISRDLGAGDFLKALKLFLRANIVEVLGPLREDNKRLFRKNL